MNTCYKCGKEHSQKGHLDAHLKKQKTCQKCSIGFNSQYCYVDGNCIRIQDYVQNKKDKLLCYRGHELVCCKGEKNKPHFRHKNSDDVGGEPMTEWHLRMQSYFPVTEKYFKNNNESQLKARRADVVIEEFNYVIEIQHSKIDDANVKCRHDDYRIHGMDVIWIVDGNTKDIKLEELSTGNFLIIFSEDWKYKSFKHPNEYILLDVNDKIFKIPVKKVCNKMILVKEWKDIEQVMKELNQNPSQIWNHWEDDNEVKATLTVHQKGAGNGKTYGIWKTILTNEDKELFIIITKQHSAKEVIKNELDEQAKRHEMHIENLTDKSYETYNKKFKVRYTHKESKRNCLVIIGTIDSFMYNVVDATHVSGNNFFKSLLETIHEEGCTKVNSNTGGIKYAGELVSLNKKAEIWIDEAQDLGENYFNAIAKVMYETKTDVVVVGDELQSLDYKMNIMTKTNEPIPNIHIIKETPINNNRRIDVEYMTDKLNTLVHFDKFNMLPISIDSKRNNPLLEHGENVIETIDMPVVYNDITYENTNKMEKFIDHIIEKVEYEVQLNDYQPEDFLFIFPFMKGTPIPGELETRLNEYWIDKFPENKDEYIKYTVLHKHEEGKVIDMSISKKASRIVTIKSSKGDGRKVVFVLSCTEKALNIVSQCDEIDLMYESYFHVAMTRAKNKVYFGLTKNNDDIHERFGSNGLVEYEPLIKKTIGLDKVLRYIDKESIMNLLKENGVEEPENEEPTPKEEVQMVDWNYHCVRRAIYLMYALFTIYKKNKDKDSFNKSQLKVVLEKIKNLPIIKRSPKQFYSYLRTICIDIQFEYFPLCDLSHKPIYKQYSTKIQNIMKGNQSKYKKNVLSLGELSPLEMVIQWYMIEIYKDTNYHQTTPTTIYNILDYFEKDEDNKVTELLKEAETIKDTTTNAMNEILCSDSENDWNIWHNIKYGGASRDIKIKKSMEIIGWSDTMVYHMIFKSDFNKLNYWDTMIELLLGRFMIYNTSDKGNDVEKFKNKPIKTYLFSLKSNCYEVFDWNWDKENSEKMKEECKHAIVKHYSTFNKQLFQYCSFIKKSNKWKDKGFKTPFDYISSQYEDVAYVRDFFKELHHKSKDNKEEVKRFTNNEKEFCDKMKDYIEEMCEKFFGLNIIVEEDDDW